MRGYERTLMLARPFSQEIVTKQQAVSLADGPLSNVLIVVQETIALVQLTHLVGGVTDE